MGLYLERSFSRLDCNRSLQQKLIHPQSFVGGIVAYRALPRPQFASLQQAIFPIYFSLQTALPVVIALTYPGENTVLGSTSSGFGGVLAEGNRMRVLAPLLMVFGSSLLNLAVVGPATTRIMRERKHQGTVRLVYRGQDRTDHFAQKHAMERRVTTTHPTRKR